MTITINDNVDWARRSFESVEDLREYLAELQLASIQNPEFFEELDRRDTNAELNPKSLRSLAEITQRLQ